MDRERSSGTPRRKQTELVRRATWLRKTIASVVFLLAAIAVLSGLVLAQSGIPSIPYGWPSKSSKLFTVVYAPGYEGDASKILGYAEQAWQILRDYTGVVPPSGVRIGLFDAKTWPRDPSSTSANPQNQELYMLAPSAQPPNYRSWCDDAWYEKNVIHEFAHVALRQLWGTIYNNNPPFWLSEGLPEYISVFMSTPAIRQKYTTYDQEIRRAKLNADPVFGLTPGTSYCTAAMYVRFLEETYGKGTVLQILRFNGTLSDAYRQVTKDTPEEIRRKWEEWINRNF